MTEANKIKRQQMYIAGAVSYWTDKKNGVNHWWDKSRYNAEYCDKQMQYFKDLKL